jgi:hypothetical protein
MSPANKPAKSGGSKARTSTGPKTELGKQRSSRNSLKHGVLSKHLIIEGERTQDYNRLLSGLMEAHQPQGMAEQMLVERMAVATWKQQRLIRVETADINGRLESERAARVREKSSMMQSFASKTEIEAFAMPVNLDKILRYQSQLEAQFYRALIALQSLQTNRQKIIEAEIVDEPE